MTTTERMALVAEFAEKMGFVDYVMIGVDIDNKKEDFWSVGLPGMSRSNTERIDRMIGAMARLGMQIEIDVDKEIVKGVERGE